MATPRRAFLDANVIRGQLTNDIMLSLAHDKLFEPRWTQHVLDEAKRNRPAGVTESRADARFAQMNKAFPQAMTAKPDDNLTNRMQADEKDKHVLAGAVVSKSTVLVTENDKDFHPPTTGPDAMPVERTSAFLNKVLQENPERVVAALTKMVERNRREPQTMPQLIDKMATQQDLKGFAHQLNASEALPPDQRGTHPNLQQAKFMKAALDGVPPAKGAGVKPASTPEARKTEQGAEKGAEKER